MIANEKMTERGLALRQGKEFKTVIKTPTRSKKKDRSPCVAFLHKNGMWTQSRICYFRTTEVDALNDSELKARFGLSEITWNECDWEIYMSEKPMTLNQAQNWKPIRAGTTILHYYAD